MRIINWLAATALAVTAASAADEAAETYLYAGGWGERNPPSTIRRVFDVAAGPDGNLYVLHEGGDTGTYIQVFDAAGESLRIWGDLPKFVSGGALAFDGRGNVYVVFDGDSEVVRFTAEGERIGGWEYKGWSDVEPLSDLACAPDGTTYVVDGRGHVNRFTAEGKHLGDVTPTGATGEAADVRAVAVDDEGRFYVAADGKHVFGYERDGSPVAEITWGDDFGNPKWITVGPDNFVYVSDGYRVRAFGTDGSARGEWGPGRLDERGEPEWIQGLAVGRDGTVYAADYYQNDILCFAADGGLEGTIDATVMPPGYFDDPGGVAVSPEGKVYVADDSGRRVQHFTAEGELLGEWSERGESGPLGAVAVAIAPGGEVVALYGHPPVVVYYTSGGRRLRRWPMGGVGHWDRVSDLAVDAEGVVYALVGNSERTVLRFSPEGEWLDAWGKEGEGPGEFGGWVNGIAVSRDGRVYVSDCRNDRVLCFTRTGKYLGGRSVEASKWYVPEKLAIGPSGDVFVGCGSEVHRYTADGEFITKWGGAGTYPGQFKDIKGIAVAADGTVYVVDGGNYRVQYFRQGTPAPPPVPEGGLQYHWGDE